MPSTSPSQHRLMEAAAHTPGGYDGVPQKVGQEFVRNDAWNESDHPRDESGKFTNGLSHADVYGYLVNTEDSGGNVVKSAEKLASDQPELIETIKKELGNLGYSSDKINAEKTRVPENENKTRNSGKTPEVNEFVKNSAVKINMYHGSPEGIEDIKPYLGMIWLTSNKEYAREFANSDKSVHKLYANIENPLDVSKIGSYEKTLDEWESFLYNEGVDISKIDFIDWASDYGKYEFFDLLPHSGNNYFNGKDNGLISALKDAGYDGIKAPTEKQNNISSGETFVAFSSEQIKKDD